MRFVKGWMVVGLAFSFCMAQTVNLSGTVTAGGSPLAGATVWLLHAGLMDTTDANGHWSLGGSTAISERNSQAISSAMPVALSPKGEIQLNLQEPARVAVKTYSAQGKQMGSMEKTFGVGSHSIMPARTNTGIYLYQVVVNGKAYMLQQANVNGRTFAQANSGTVAQQALAKSTAIQTFPDSIYAWKPQYYEAGVNQATTTGSGITIDITAAPSSCTLFQTCANDGITDPPNSSYAGYYVQNNLWNPGYVYTECMNVCSYHYWNVVVTMNNSTNDGACKTFPCVHKLYENNPLNINSLTTLTVDFSERTPHGANMIYEGAFDIWVNGVCTTTCTEFMIWNDNFHQWSDCAPAMPQVTLSGRLWTPHVTMQGGTGTSTHQGYIMFEPTPYFYDACNFNVLEILKYGIAQGWVPTTSTLYQVEYGFEMVSTNNIPSTFYLNNYMVHTY